AARPATARAGRAQPEPARYREASRRVWKMVDLRPGLGSSARVSYARELFGAVPGAIEAMQKAVEAGGPVPENSAYTRVLLGNLYLNAGRPQQADREYRQALFEYPGYPFGLAGIARV